MTSRPGVRALLQGKEGNIMAHQLEIMANGEASMMYAGKAPWHGLGTPVETEVTAGAALKLAGLDWTVEKRALFTRGRRMAQAGQDFMGRRDVRQAVRRTPAREPIDSDINERAG